MKDIYFIILCLLLINCGANKESKTEQVDIYDLIKKGECEVVLPENWTQLFDVHKFLYFTPKELQENFIENRISIMKLSSIGESSLESVAENQLKLFKKNYKIEVENISTEQTAFGETLIYKFDQYWNAIHVVNHIKYFRVKDSYYAFQYSSFPSRFDKYLSEANFIYDNLIFK